MSIQSSKKSDTFKSKLRHAFAVKDQEGYSDEEMEFMDDVANFICRRQLEAPAIMGLVTVKPLSFLGSQLLLFLEPFLTPFFNEKQYKRLVNILSKREGIETFVQILEQKTNERENKKESRKEEEN